MRRTPPKRKTPAAAAAGVKTRNRPAIDTPHAQPAEIKAAPPGDAIVPPAVESRSCREYSGPATPHPPRTIGPKGIARPDMQFLRQPGAADTAAAQRSRYRGIHRSPETSLLLDPSFAVLADYGLR